MFGSLKRMMARDEPIQQDRDALRTMVDIVSFYPAFRVGRGVFLGASKLSKIPSVLSGIKRPGHSLLLARSRRDLGWLGGPLAPRTQAALANSLKIRSRIGLGLLGYSIVNPIENLLYIQRRDWERLVVNYHLPFIGVPIYNRLIATGSKTEITGVIASKDPFFDSVVATLVEGSSSETYQQNGGPSTPRPAARSARAKSYNPPWLQEGRERVLSGTRCPPGHHWSYRQRKCIRTKKWHKR